jgi:uncharacterized protein
VVITWVGFIVAGLGGLAAGFINALAGGGTLISFPLLTAIGLPPVVANVTNTVALCPGYIGGVIAQFEDLKAQKRFLWLYVPAGIVGGLIGGVLLLNSGEKMFRSLIPFLILLASGLLAVSDPLKAWITRRIGKDGSKVSMAAWGIIPVLLAAVYGGYFGAGLSVIVLAVLGLVLNDSLTRLNALKQAISFVVNTSAAVFFIFSGKVNWSIAVVMAVFSLLGGALGGRLAGKIKPATLRWLVVSIGTVVAIIYFFK